MATVWACPPVRASASKTVIECRRLSSQAACEAGNAGADNGDPHEFLSPQRAYAVAAITTPTGSDRVGWVTLRDSSALGSSERWRDVFT